MSLRAIDDLVALVRPELRALSAYKTPPDALPIKLDANESPFDLPEEVMLDLAERLRAMSLRRYPDLEVRALREALAEDLGTDPARLVVGTGSDESIAVLLMALARPRDPRAPVVVVPEPTFVMYAHSARVLGLCPVSVPLVGSDFALDADAIVETVRKQCACAVFLASPNNPTGIAYPDDAIVDIAERCPRTLVVVDEAYAAFRPRRSDGTRSHRDALRRQPSDVLPNVVFLGTLSKIGLASLRVGWVEAPPALAREFDKVRLPYDIAGPSQVLATHVLRAHRAALDDCIARVVAERDRLGATLARAHARGGPLRPLPSEANFFLCEAPSAASARDVHAHLARCGIAVRAFASSSLDKHLRITVGTRAENDALAAALDEFAPGSS